MMMMCRRFFMETWKRWLQRSFASGTSRSLPTWSFCSSSASVPSVSGPALLWAKTRRRPSFVRGHRCVRVCVCAQCERVCARDARANHDLSGCAQEIPSRDKDASSARFDILMNITRAEGLRGRPKTYTLTLSIPLVAASTAEDKVPSLQHRSSSSSMCACCLMC